MCSSSLSTLRGRDAAPPSLSLSLFFSLSLALLRALALSCVRVLLRLRLLCEFDTSKVCHELDKSIPSSVLHRQNQAENSSLLPTAGSDGEERAGFIYYSYKTRPPHCPKKHLPKKIIFWRFCAAGLFLFIFFLLAEMINRAPRRPK